MWLQRDTWGACLGLLGCSLSQLWLFCLGLLHKSLQVLKFIDLPTRKAMLL